jgi:hypothetical protein
MFEDLRKEFSDMLGEFRIGEPTRTLTVAKPFCSPARHIVTGALQPYGVKILNYAETIKTAGVRGMIKQMGLSEDSFDGNTKVALPMAQVAKVEVSAKAAAWAEYLLLRTGRLYVVGDYVNRRLKRWTTTGILQSQSVKAACPSMASGRRAWWKAITLTLTTCQRWSN